MESADPACTATCARIGRSEIHGRGVFARSRIHQGDCVIENVVLVLGPEDVRPGDVVKSYCYEWPFDGDGRALALGEGSLLNHAPRDADGVPGPRGANLRANLRWETDTAAERIRFYALRHIEPGEELLIDYGDEHVWLAEK